MTDIDPWEMDEDDPEAPWNKDPVEGMPDVILPGRIKVQLWFYLGAEKPMAHDVIFTWGGGRAVDWFYDISDDNPGLSVMSSAPFTGEASWANGSDMEITYSASEFGRAGELRRAAPKDDALNSPQTWVSLAEYIAGHCNGLMMDGEYDEEDDPDLDG